MGLETPPSSSWLLRRAFSLSLLFLALFKGVDGEIKVTVRHDFISDKQSLCWVIVPDLGDYGPDSLNDLGSESFSYGATISQSLTYKQIVYMNMAITCGDDNTYSMEDMNAMSGIETYCHDPVWSWSYSDGIDSNTLYSYDCYLNATTKVKVNTTSGWQYEPANFTLAGISGALVSWMNDGSQTPSDYWESSSWDLFYDCLEDWQDQVYLWWRYNYLSYGSSSTSSPSSWPSSSTSSPTSLPTSRRRRLAGEHDFSRLLVDTTNCLEKAVGNLSVSVFDGAVYLVPWVELANYGHAYDFPFNLSAYWDAACEYLGVIEVDLTAVADPDTGYLLGDYPSSPDDTNTWIDLTPNLKSYATADEARSINCTWIISPKIKDAASVGVGQTGFSSIWVALTWPKTMPDGDILRVYDSGSEVPKSTSCLHNSENSALSGKSCVAQTASQLSPIKSQNGSIVIVFTSMRDSPIASGDEDFDFSFKFTSSVCLDPDCSGNGECLYGECVCNAGYRGTLCNLNVPDNWVCETERYNTSDGCDCSCQAPDPDCNINDFYINNCSSAGLVDVETSEYYLWGATPTGACTHCPLPANVYTYEEEYPVVDDDSYICTESNVLCTNCDTQTGLCVEDDNSVSSGANVKHCRATSQCPSGMYCVDGTCSTSEADDDDTTTGSVSPITDSNMVCNLPFSSYTYKVNEGECDCNNGDYNFTYSDASIEAITNVKAILGDAFYKMVSTDCGYFSPTNTVLTHTVRTSTECVQTSFYFKGFPDSTAESQAHFTVMNSTGSIASDEVSGMAVQGSDSDASAFTFCLGTGLYTLEVSTNANDTGGHVEAWGNGFELGTAGNSSSASLLVCAEQLTEFYFEASTGAGASFIVEESGGSGPTVDLVGQSMNGSLPGTCLGATSYSFCVASDVEYTVSVLEEQTDTTLQFWDYEIRVKAFGETSPRLRGYLGPSSKSIEQYYYNGSFWSDRYDAWSEIGSWCSGCDCDSSSSPQVYIDMYDSYGDGWNGNYLGLYSSNDSLINSYTLIGYRSSSASICIGDDLSADTCYTLKLSTPGTWQSEISWDFCDGTGYDVDSSVSFCIDSSYNCSLSRRLIESEPLSDGNPLSLGGGNGVARGRRRLAEHEQQQQQEKEEEEVEEGRDLAVENYLNDYSSFTTSGPSGANLTCECWEEEEDTSESSLLNSSSSDSSSWSSWSSWSSSWDDGEGNDRDNCTLSWDSTCSSTDLRFELCSPMWEYWYFAKLYLITYDSDSDSFSETREKAWGWEFYYEDEYCLDISGWTTNQTYGLSISNAAWAYQVWSISECGIYGQRACDIVWVEIDEYGNCAQTTRPGTCSDYGMGDTPDFTFMESCKSYFWNEWLFAYYYPDNYSPAQEVTFTLADPLSCEDVLVSVHIDCSGPDAGYPEAIGFDIHNDHDWGQTKDLWGQSIYGVSPESNDKKSQLYTYCLAAGYWYQLSVWNDYYFGARMTVATQSAQSFHEAPIQSINSIELLFDWDDGDWATFHIPDPDYYTITISLAWPSSSGFPSEGSYEISSSDGHTEDNTGITMYGTGIEGTLTNNYTLVGDSLYYLTLSDSAGDGWDDGDGTYELTYSFNGQNNSFFLASGTLEDGYYHELVFFVNTTNSGTKLDSTFVNSQGEWTLSSLDLTGEHHGCACGVCDSDGFDMMRAKTLAAAYAGISDTTLSGKSFCNALTDTSAQASFYFTEVGQEVLYTYTKDGSGGWSVNSSTSESSHLLGYECFQQETYSDCVDNKGVYYCPINAAFDTFQNCSTNTFLVCSDPYQHSYKALSGHVAGGGVSSLSSACSLIIAPDVPVGLQPYAQVELELNTSGHSAPLDLTVMEGDDYSGAVLKKAYTDIVNMIYKLNYTSSTNLTFRINSIVDNVLGDAPIGAALAFTGAYRTVINVSSSDMAVASGSCSVDVCLDSAQKLGPLVYDAELASGDLTTYLVEYSGADSIWLDFAALFLGTGETLALYDGEDDYNNAVPMVTLDSNWFLDVDSGNAAAFENESYILIQDVGFPTTVAFWYKGEANNASIFSASGDLEVAVVSGALKATVDGNGYYARKAMDTNQWAHVAVLIEEGLVEFVINGRRYDSCGNAGLFANCSKATKQSLGVTNKDGYYKVGGSGVFSLDHLMFFDEKIDMAEVQGLALNGSFDCDFGDERLTGCYNFDQTFTGENAEKVLDGSFEQNHAVAYFGVATGAGVGDAGGPSRMASTTFATTSDTLYLTLTPNSSLATTASFTAGYRAVTNCSCDSGTCVRGVCQCDAGYGGETCNTWIVSSACSTDIGALHGDEFKSVFGMLNLTVVDPVYRRWESALYPSPAQPLALPAMNCTWRLSKNAGYTRVDIGNLEGCWAGETSELILYDGLNHPGEDPHSKLAHLSSFASLDRTLYTGSSGEMQVTLTTPGGVWTCSNSTGEYNKVQLEYAQPTVYFVAPNTDFPVEGTRDGSAESPFSSIYSALNAASDNDVIILYPGRYEQSAVVNNIGLTINFPVTIRGLSEPEYTVMDANLVSRHFHVSVSYGKVIFENIQFLNGKWSDGASLKIDNSIVELNNCAFKINSASSGGTLNAAGSSLILSEVTFESNTLSSAMYIYSTTVTASNTSFTMNTNTRADEGLITLFDSKAVFSGTSLVSNSNTGGGSAGFYVNGEDSTEAVSLTVTDTEFYGNLAEHYTCFLITGANAYLDLSSTTFMQNQGSGLITVQYSASITVDGIYAENNYAYDASECNGIFHGSNPSMFTLANSEFTSSSIPAVYIDNSINTPVISSTSFSHHNITSTKCSFNLGFVEGSSCPQITDVTYKGNKVGRGVNNVVLSSCGSAIIDQSSFSKNSAYDGGALYVENAAVTVKFSEFKHNYANGYGGGAIMVYGTDESQEVVFEQVVFTENECDGYGGAVLLSSVENAIGKNIEFTNCTGNGGGSLSLIGATASFEDLHIVSSTGASYGGGISAISMSTLTLNGFTIKDSNSPLGGAISVRSQSLLYLKDGIMDQNRADEGGGLAIQEDSDFTIQRTTISNSYATLSGGALFLVKVTPSETSLDQVNMFNNTAVELGGAIYAALCDNLILTNVIANNSVGLVSGANIASLASNWEISNSQMFEAYSEQGSLYLLHSEFISIGNNFSNGTSNSNGGLLYAFASQLYVNDTSFGNGKAGDTGGGLFLFDSESIFYRTTFSRNTAGSNGGGLYVTGTQFVYFYHCTFAWNYANVGAGVYFSSNNDLILYGSLFDHNIVYQQGAGMYVSTVDRVTITTSEFVSNWVDYGSYESSYGGGALYFNYIDDLTIRSNKFIGNGGAYTDGGAIWIGYSYAYLKSNTFNRNTAYNGAGVYLGPEPDEATTDYTGTAERRAAWEASVSGLYEAGGEGYSQDGRRRRFLRAHDRRLAEATVSSTVTLTGSTFSGGAATAGGGAFYYEENEPAGAANLTYSNNSAAFGSDLVSLPAYIDANKSSDLEVSGQVLTATYVYLRDVYGQVYGLESGGTVFATATTDGSAVGGTSSTTFYEGVATFDELTATLSPNTVMNVSFSAAGTVDGTATIEVVFRSCLTGEIVENGQCVECNYGTFSLDTADWTCYDCPFGAVCNGGKDIRAKNGYWRMNTTIYNRAGTCNEEDGEPTFEGCSFFACYTDGACLGDILLSNLSRANVHEGTLTFSEPNILTKLDSNCGINNGNYTHCQISVEGNIFHVMDAYESGNNIDIKVTGNMTSLKPDEYYQVHLMLEEECGTGYKGNVCAKCRPGYGATGFALCEKCPDSLLVSYILVSLGCLAVVFIGALLIKMNMNKDNSENERLSIMLKIFTNYMQLVSLFGGLEISWPDAIVKLFEGQETVSRVGDKLIIIDCVLNDAQSQAGAYNEDDDNSTFFQKLAFYMAAPILAVFFSGIFWTYQYFKKARKFSKKKNWDIESEKLAPFTEDGLITKDEIPGLLMTVGENSQPMRVTDIVNFMGLALHPARTEDFKEAFLNCYLWLMKENAILSVVVLLFLLYPTVTTYNFQVFTCVELGTGQWFLQNDLDTECYTPLHNLWLLACGVPFLVLYTVGIPYSAYLVLHHYRYDLDDKHVKLKYGFLYDGFERNYYYWEMCVMVRKVAVISSTVFIPQFFGDLTEVLAGLCICLTSLLFHLNCQPYEDDQLDVLEALSLYTTVLTMICGLFFYSGELLAWGRSLMIVFIIFFNVAFIIYFCYAAYTDFRQKIFANYRTAIETVQMVKSRLSGKKISKEEQEMISQATEKFVEFEVLMNDRMKLKDKLLRNTVEIQELKRALRVKRGENEDVEHEVHMNEAQVIELMEDNSAVTQYMLYGGEAGPGKITAEELYAHYPDLRKEEEEKESGTLAAGDGDNINDDKTCQRGRNVVQDRIIGFFQAQKNQQELELKLKANNKKREGFLPNIKKKKKQGGDGKPTSTKVADPVVKDEVLQLDHSAAAPVDAIFDDGSAKNQQELEVKQRRQGSKPQPYYSGEQKEQLEKSSLHPPPPPGRRSPSAVAKGALRPRWQRGEAAAAAQGGACLPTTPDSGL